MKKLLPAILTAIVTIQSVPQVAFAEEASFNQQPFGTMPFTASESREAAQRGHVASLNALADLEALNRAAIAAPSASPFTAMASTGTDGRPDFAVTVDAKGVLRAAYKNRTLTGKYDFVSGRAVLKSADSLETWTISIRDEAGVRTVASFRTEQGGVSVDRKFDRSGLLAARTGATRFSDGSVSETADTFAYARIGGRPIVNATTSLWRFTDSDGRILQEAETRASTRYGTDGAAESSVSLQRIVENGQDFYGAAAFEWTDSPSGQVRTSASLYGLEENLFRTIGAADADAVISRAIVVTEAHYGAGRLRFLADRERDAAGVLRDKRTILPDGTIRIVVGEADPRDGGSDDLVFRQTSVGGWSTFFGDNYEAANGFCCTIYEGYGLAFTKYVGGVPGEERKVQVVVDYPRVKTVELEGVTYRIDLAGGEVRLTEEKIAAAAEAPAAVEEIVIHSSLPAVEKRAAEPFRIRPAEHFVPSFTSPVPPQALRRAPSDLKARTRNASGRRDDEDFFGAAEV